MILKRLAAPQKTQRHPSNGIGDARRRADASRLGGVVALVLLLVAAGAPAQPDLDDPTRAYSFLIAGHAYGSPAVTEPQGLHPPLRQRLHQLTEPLAPDFGVFVGDTVYRGTEEHWDAVDRDLEDVPIPIHMALGNHDLTGRELFVERYGEPFRSFRHGGDLFIFLDPYLDGWSIRGEQLAALRSLLLDGEPFRYAFVFVHPLIWWEEEGPFEYVSINSEAHRTAPVNFWSELRPLFDQTQKDYFFIAGDLGAFPASDTFLYYRSGRMTLLATGMGGGVRDSMIDVRISEDGSVEFDLIALNGPDPDALGQLEDYQLPGPVDIAKRLLRRVHHKLTEMLDL